MYQHASVGFHIKAVVFNDMQTSNMFLSRHATRALIKNNLQNNQHSYYHCTYAVHWWMHCCIIYQFMIPAKYLSIEARPNVQGAISCCKVLTAQHRGDVCLIHVPHNIRSRGNQCIGWITIKVPKWGRIIYKMKYITEHHNWYEIVTYGLRDIYSKFKSTTVSAYQDIHKVTKNMFVGGMYTSYQYTSIGNCALIYHTICD